MTKWLARAKVNLVLDVVGPRSDGYHELATIFQSIDLADVLSVEPAQDIEVTCDMPGIPGGPGNLAFRAAALLREATGVSAGARIDIQKRIPAGAGLGGGSADAAATLVALNALWGLGLEQSELARLAAEIGSDVPFMIAGGTCLGRGRGEILTPVPCPGTIPLVVVVPPVTVATAGAYQALDGWTSPVHPRVESALAALSCGDWRKLAGCLGNSFEAPIIASEPAIGRVLDRIKTMAGEGVVMSGSGSSLVIVAPAADVVSKLRAKLPGCFVWAGSSAAAGVSQLTENKPVVH